MSSFCPNRLLSQVKLVRENVDMTRSAAGQIGSGIYTFRIPINALSLCIE